MTRPTEPNDPIEEIEDELAELGDPETGPNLPATTLAAAGGSHGPPKPARARTGITREIVRLGLPVMASQVLMSLTGIVDRMMIGHLDDSVAPAIALAAVGYATQFFFLIQSALFAVGLACVALMARAIGANDPARAREALISSLQVSVIVTIGFTAIMIAFAEPILIALGAEPAVIEVGLPYLVLVVGSSLILSISIVLDSALRANKNTRTPMLVAIAVAAVKLLLNWVLIYGAFGAPKMGLTGAGWASAISQIVGLGLFLAIFARRPASAPDHVETRRLFRPNSMTREVIRIALPGIGERVVLNLGLLSYFWVLSSAYGTVSVAAYTIGVPLLSFSWIPGSGYAQACATMVGQRLGAHDPEGATRTGVRATWLAIATSIPLGLFYAIFREPLGAAFTNDPDVIAALGPFMLALAIGQPFLQLHFTLGGAHRGAGDTWTPLVGAAVGNWIFRVPLACLFAFVLDWSVLWVWYALVIDHVARSAILLVSFRRGRWRERLG